MTDPEAASPSEASPAEELKRALKAFKKRLKLTRLDYESKLGYGPMTKGGNSGIVAIMPPNQFPPTVWEELVRQGKLKSLGHGLYELAPGA
jgi:hypothetical protein